MSCALLPHLGAEVSHSSGSEQPAAVSEEAHEGDGLVVKLWKLQGRCGRKHRLQLLLPVDKASLKLAPFLYDAQMSHVMLQVRICHSYRTRLQGFVTSNT